MGLITGILTLPLAPVRGTIAIAEQMRREAERQYYDPAAIRRQLEQIDRLRSSGDLTDEEAEALENDLVERLLVGRDAHQWEA